MLEQLWSDAARKPRLFLWNGPIPMTDLDAWLAARDLVVPDDLRYLWSATGGGELFESEELWAPLAPPLFGADFAERNAWYHRQGMAPAYLLFSTGCLECAVRQPDGTLIELVGRTFAPGRTFRSLEEWYGLLRAEFGPRYGLPEAAGPSP